MAYDVVISGGTVYDGSGDAPRVADIGIVGDRVVAIGELSLEPAGTVLDACGWAVAPGFVNMLSHSYITILHDPRSLGELKQGVTTQIFGEGESMGPLTPDIRALMQRNMGEMQVQVEWSRLSEYLAHAEKHGISQNVASFIGATTLRIHEVGHDNRRATPMEIDRMSALVDEEMADGALGIGSSLIYPPAFYASTEELVALCRPAARHGGMYISHMRSEGNHLVAGVEELLRISREAELPAEIWHLKAAGQANWHLIPRVIEMVEEARQGGPAITADVYTYTAGATGLSNAIHPRCHDGGSPRLFERLEDPVVRAEIRDVIESDDDGWENLYRGAGGPDGVLILGVRKAENRKYQGKTLTQVSEMMSCHPIDALMDLVAADRSRISTAYFMMSEDNLRLQIRQPWVSFGSDAGSMSTEGVFLNASTHPRSYGTFARLLGRYVREEGLIPLEEAVRRLSAFPAATLGLDRRGLLAPGWFADVVVFDPDTIADRATYDEPHQYAVGVRDVVVNGVVTLRDGEFTGAFGGRALRGRGGR